MSSVLFSCLLQLYAGRYDHVGGSHSTTVAGLQSEARHQPAGQCGQLHVLWCGISGMSLFAKSETVLKHIQIIIWCLPDTNGASKVLFVMVILAKTCTRSSHQPEGPPRCLDQSGHHTGVLTEHEDKSMSTLMCFPFCHVCNFESSYWMSTLGCFHTDAFGARPGSVNLMNAVFQTLVRTCDLYSI